MKQRHSPLNTIALRFLSLLLGAFLLTSSTSKDIPTLTSPPKQMMQSEVFIEVNWPLFSGENLVELYNSSNQLLFSVCNPSACFDGTNGGSYSATISAGCQPDGGGYYLILYDTFMDEWNAPVGSTAFVQVKDASNNILFGPTTHTGGSQTTTGTFSVSGGGALCNLSGTPCTAESENTTTTVFADNSCGSPAVMTFNVTDDLTITDLNVGLNISVTPTRHHVNVELTSPMGTSVTLIQAPLAANFFNDLDILMDSGAGGPILDNSDDNLAAPFYDRTTGTSQSLSAFNGQNTMGTWTLEICDDSNADPALGGTLNQATLFFSGFCPDDGGTSFPDADYTIDTGGMESTCSGIFADSGDTNGDYSDGETHTMTFCSDLNNQISFTFEHFNTEANNDELTIYDGSTTGAPSLGTFSGTNSPGVVTSSGTCLTFEFNSNGSTTAPGWLASISCTGLPDPGAVAASWTGYPTASACSVNSEIGGTVYEDIDNDGTQDTREPGIFGVTVTLFDDSGQVGSPVTTDGNGEYVFNGLTASTVYRVEFAIPEGFFEGPYGSNSGTAVQFIESGRCDANLGLADPAHYCDDTDPYFVTPCYANGDPQHSSNMGTTGVARFRYSDSGDSPSATYTNYVTVDAVGSTWGVAWDGIQDRLFMSSVLKRHVGLGPDGIGAIYVHNDGDANNSASVFYDFGAAAGVVVDNATRFPGSGDSFGEEGPCGTCDNIDPTTFDQAGKVGFGDIDVNESNSKLYVSNLFDRKVYTIDLDSPTPGSATPLPSIPWLDNSPCSNGVARPWALEFRRDKLYVGVICDASFSSCAPGTACSDLTAIVYSFDGTSWTNELSFPLDYYREAYTAGSDYFVKWIDDWNTMAPFVANITDANFAQPVIMDLEFDDDNSIIIGIGDRTGLQMGYQAPNPTSDSDDTSERNMAFGDILRAAYNNTTDTYTLESNGVVGGLTTTNPTSNTGPGGKSFYWGDYWTGIGANKYQGAVGALMLLPNSGEVATSLADAADYYSNGITWMRNTNGSDVKRLEVYQGDPDGNSPNFAKGTGVGDMVLLCGPRPIEIGNIVWWDDDLDGLQDPSEPGIPGVTLELWLDPNGSAQGNNELDGSAVKVAETTTDAYGRYIFSYDGNSNGLSAENWGFTANDQVLPNTFYQVRIANWATEPAIVAYRNILGYADHLLSPTQNQGPNGGERDNNAYDNPGNAAVAVATGNYGDNNHSYDFAFGGVGGCVAPTVVPTANTPCEGTDLNLMAAVSGGAAPYSYQWSGPNGFTSTVQNPTIAGVDSLLNVGQYSLTVTDDAGCVDTTHIHIAINRVTLITAATDATCGSSDGEIDLTINGFPPYTIDWDNDGTGDNDDTEDLTGLASGTYNVTVTDANGCMESTSVSIGSSGSVTLAETHVDETCTLGNGSIDLTITGAFTTIDWDNDGTGDNDDPEDLSGLSAGTYTVTVNNAANCPAVLTVELTDTPGPMAAATQVNTTCGASNGSIDLTVNGGTAPYQFDWDNDGTGDNDDTEDLSGLAAGPYSVTVTDATGCTAIVMVTLNDTPGPSLSAVPTDETCGNANGSIDLTVTGGTGPFMYAWSNGLMTQDISGLGAGAFSVTVTDANGCTATTMATVNNTDGPTLAVTPTNATDCNTNDGSIDLTVSGGAMPYSYDWDIDGFGDNDDVEDPSGLASGTYMVIVTDNNGCQATISTTILNAADPVLSAVITDPTTCGGTGSVDLTITGGNGPFSIDWSNDGLGDNDDMEDISGLAGGAYTVIVTGADGCSAQYNISIQVIRDPVLNPTIVDPNCGASDGSITLAISDPDGTGPYTFDWDNDGTGDNDDPQDLTGLAPGNYSVTVTNGIGCTATATYSLSPSAAPTLTVFQTNPTCDGTNGSIDLEVAGGVMPYSYDWDNDGTGDNDDMQDLSGLSAGTYSVTVTDNVGCQAVESVTLISTVPPSLNALLTPEDCGMANGAIDLTISGIAPFTIDWDNDGTGDNDDNEDLSGLSAGMYSVTVTDGNGCFSTASYTVTENPNPTISASPACDPGNTTYSITVTTTVADQLTSDEGSVSGSAPNFTVSGITVGTDANLTATNTINGCSVMELVMSPVCTCPAGLPSVTGDTRCGTGIVNLSATSGANCDEIRWYDMETGGTLVNTGPTYSPTLSSTTSFHVACYNTASNCESARVEVVATINANPTLAGGSVCVGDMITLTGSGTPNGTDPYVSDNTGVATVTSGGVVTGVAMGTANITYTDDNGCTASAMVTVNANPTLAGGSLCVGDMITLTGSGTPNGTDPYVSDNTGVATVTSGGVVTGVAMGTANITYTDNNGCTASAMVTVNATPTLAGGSVCIGDMITLTGSGTPNATDPYVSDNTGVATVTSGGVVTGVAMGTANITYTDDNGCSVTAEVTVNVNPTITASQACDPSNLTYTITVTTTDADQLTSDVGNVGGMAPNFTVTNIPAGTDANLTATNTLTNCTVMELVTSPVCNTCVDPTASFVPVPGSCDGLTQNNDGRIVLTAFSDATHYTLRLDTDPAPADDALDFASATAIMAAPQDLATGISNAGASYVIRIYNDASDCYEEFMVEVPMANCPTDPQGYIYCEESGQIITGGTIAVSGPSPIVITLDGSTGEYQFFTDGTPGTYTITYTPPVGYSLSTNRLPSGTLDPTGQADPFSIGSNSTDGMFLDDFSQAANTFYLVFDFEAGDPEILLNNIPLQGCDPCVVEAGTDQTICSSATIDLTTIGASITFDQPVTATWSTSGTGTFDDTNMSTGVFGTATTYTPSAADIANGQVILTLTADDPSLGCNEDTVDIIILNVDCGFYPWDGNN